MIRIESYNAKKLNDLIDSDIDFEMDSTNNIQIKIPEKALNIIIKPTMYAEDVSDIILSEKTDVKDKVDLNNPLPIAPNHECILSEYFNVNEIKDGYAYITIRLQDERGGFNKFSKEQVKFVKDVFGGVIEDCTFAKEDEPIISEIKFK